MPTKTISPQQKVIDYYQSFDSRVFYALLGGVKHFGYFPEGQEQISISAAQELMTDRLGERLDPAPGSLLLDAGCGEGPVALRLAQQYDVRIVGVDILSPNIKRAQQKAQRLGLETSVEFHLMDYTRLAFADQTFDGVYTMETLVHAPDYHDALRELHRVLKDGGKIVLFEYSMSPVEELTPAQRRIADLVNRESGMHSLPHFTHGSFPRILEDAGFGAVTVEDITPRIAPMFRRMYRWAWLPYQAIKLLRLERHFVNPTTVVEGIHPIFRQGAARYNIITARKHGS